MNPDAFDLPAYLTAVGARVTAAIDDCLPGTEPGNRLDEAMRYSLMAGGKRIRPALCLAASEAVGGHTQAAVPVACALEMIHTYSLIHDDLPAMDDDDMRRGRPACHVAFDEATAILAGDALLTLAFEIIASMNSCPPGVAAAVVREVAAAAGRRGMVAGQMLDMQSEGRRLSLGELEELHGLKTGAMMEAALVCGALVGGGSALQTTSLRSYGKAVGLAFQVVDDILNVEGDPALLGKAVGTDRRREKNSYPVLLGLDRSRELAGDLMKTAVGALAAFDSKADPLRAIARYVVERKK